MRFSDAVAAGADVVAAAAGSPLCLFGALLFAAAAAGATVAEAHAGRLATFFAAALTFGAMAADNSAYVNRACVK